MPNTAVVADLTSQCRATVAVTHYLDARRECRICRRPFLFFAEEQKYWYEELQFPLEADCVRCSECRRHVHELRAMKQRYNTLLEAKERSAQETLELVEAAYTLVEAAVFTAKVVPRMRALLKRLKAGENQQVAAQVMKLLASSAAPP